MKITSIVLLIFNVLLSNNGLAAPAIKENFEAFAFSGVGQFCDSQVQEVEIIGNKTRLKLLNSAWMVSQDPRLTGQTTLDVEVFIHNVSVHISGHGSFVLQPFEFAGSWSADFNFQFPGGKIVELYGMTAVKDSKMNADGTGEFDGLKLSFDHLQVISAPPYILPVSDPDEIGGCDFLGEIWKGRIMDPNSRK